MQFCLHIDIGERGKFTDSSTKLYWTPSWSPPEVIVWLTWWEMPAFGLVIGSLYYFIIYTVYVFYYHFINYLLHLLVLLLFFRRLSTFL
jgi:hypothetical protein